MIAGLCASPETPRLAARTTGNNVLATLAYVPAAVALDILAIGRDRPCPQYAREVPNLTTPGATLTYSEGPATVIVTCRQRPPPRND